jgi:hypothetical protein
LVVVVVEKAELKWVVVVEQEEEEPPLPLPMTLKDDPPKATLN